MTRFSRTLFFFLMLFGLSGLRAAIPDGSYYILYPAAGSGQYMYPSGRSYRYGPTKTVVNVSTNASGYLVLSNSSGTFSGFPASFYVLSPTAPNNSSNYFQCIPVASSTFSGTSISVGDYSGFPWKAIPTPSTNITLNFTAKASTDLHIGLRYSSTNCIELVVGGWTNSASKVRVVNYSAGISFQEQYAATSPNPVISDTNNPIQYTLTVANGVITLLGKLSNGSTYTVVSFNQASYGLSILNTPFTGYSFRAFTPFTWTVSGDTVTSVATTFTGTRNGYSAQSAVSQADADTQAMLAWLNAKIPTGTIVNTQQGGWKAISSQVAGNMKLTFTAAALTDMWIYFQATDGSYFFLAVGCGNNTYSVIRKFSSPGVVLGSDIQIAGPSPTIPDTVNPVTYTLTIMNGQLTLTSVAGGATTTRVTYSDAALLNKTYSAYTFGNYLAAIPWKYTGDGASLNTFTGTYSGYTAQSTLSQADADAKAQAAWATAVVTSIGSSKTTAVNAVNPILTSIASANTALTAARRAFTDIASQLDALAGQAGFTPKLPWQT